MPSFNRLAAAVGRDAGYRKRKAPEDENPSHQSESSALASLLLEWVSWGTISFPMVREAAEAACKDGADSPQLRKLASLGGPHALSRNMRRDCLNNLDINFVEPEMVKLPMMPAKGEKKVQYADHPIILPHVLFQHLYDEHRDFFMQQIVEAGPQFFWEQCPRDEPGSLTTLFGLFQITRTELALSCCMAMAHSTQHITIPSKVCSGPSWDLMGWAQELGITFFSSQFWFLAFAAKKISMESTLGMWSSAWW